MYSELINRKSEQNELLDWATEIAVNLKRENVSKEELRRIVLFAHEHQDNVDNTITYIMRQAQKLDFKDSGKILVNRIQSLKNNPNDIIILLHYIQWIFETIERKPINYKTRKFIDLVNQVKKR